MGFSMAMLNNQMVYTTNIRISRRLMLAKLDKIHLVNCECSGLWMFLVNISIMFGLVSTKWGNPPLDQFN